MRECPNCPDVFLDYMDKCSECGQQNDWYEGNGKPHASDCALHNGPASEPKPCDCGADPGLEPHEYGSEYPRDTKQEKVDPNEASSLKYDREGRN